MPIEKVPIVHKFSILSQSHRQAVEDRLTRKADRVTREQERKEVKQEVPVLKDIDQLMEMIRGYTMDETQLLAIQRMAIKILKRSKRKAGLREGGVGSHVNLDEAWRELAMLSACSIENVQEDALESLLVSLFEAPVVRKQVERLFFLAQMCMRSLTSDKVDPNNIRSLELVLIKVCKLAFIRLYYHHMANDIKGFKGHMEQLYQYQKDFQKKVDDLYNQYPLAQTSLQIISDIITEMSHSYCPDAVKTDKQHQERWKELKSMESVRNGVVSTFGGSAYEGAIDDEGGDMLAGLISDQPPSSPYKTQQSLDEANLKKIKLKMKKRCMSSYDDPFHDSAPFLWHSLHVWQCQSRMSADLKVAMARLRMCAIKWADSSRLQHIFSLFILSECCKNNINIVPLFLELPSASHHKSPHATSLRGGVGETSATLPAESDKLVLPHAEPSATEREAVRTPSILRDMQDFLYPRGGVQVSRSKSSKVDNSVENGSQPNTHRSEEDRKAAHPVKQMSTEDVGEPNRWPTELIIVYLQCLTEICLKGRSSEIQRMVLVGTERFKGLIDYLQDDHANEESWCTRSAVVEGLVWIHSHFKGNSMKDGLMNLSWEALQQHVAVERDNRVIEAMKVAKIMASRYENNSAPPSNLIMSQNNTNSSPETPPAGLYARIATNLSVLLLPPLQPIVHMQSKMHLTSPRVDIQKRVNPVTSPRRKPDGKVRPNRTTICEDIEIARGVVDKAPQYSERAWVAVSDMIEDQYRKEVIEEEEYRAQIRIEKLTAEMEAIRIKNEQIKQKNKAAKNKKNETDKPANEEGRSPAPTVISAVEHQPRAANSERDSVLVTQCI